MSQSRTIETLLAPLLELLGGRSLRLVARAGWVTIDRADGPARVEVPWSDEEQRVALEALPPGEAMTLSTGGTALSLGGSLILQHPPDPLRRTDDLTADGWISPLAARLSSQALALGRNILLVGPWAASVELGAALLAEGTRPALVGGDDLASPAGWPVFARAPDARTYGADRVGCWSLSPPDLAEVMTELSGVVGWIDARRIERALIRFEAARGGGANPLQVLAALDLVVVVGDRPAPRVQSITEVVLVEEGYRPMTLFTTGLPPVPTALVPLAAPTFVNELASAGQTVLADELSHAAPEAPTSPGMPAEPEPEPELHPSSALAPAPVTLGEPMIEPPTSTSPAPGSPFVRAPPKRDPVLEDAPPPGWELDQLPEEEEGDDPDAAGDEDAAVMAATFGLAPPPRPAGVTGRGAAQFDGTFAEALGRAKQRDAELREELRQADLDEESDD